jgi:hypothetical protein
MPVTTETREVLQNFDGNGGSYKLVLIVDVDRANNGNLRSETLTEVRIDNTNRTYTTNYRATVQGLGNISSYDDPVSFPPVPPGELRVWPGLSFRIDNRDTSYSLS